MIILAICEHLCKVARIFFQSFDWLPHWDRITRSQIGSKYPILMKIETVKKFLDFVKFRQNKSGTSHLYLKLRQL